MTITRRPGPATMIKDLKTALSEVEQWKHWRNRERGKWYWDTTIAGDIAGQNKKDEITVEISRFIPYAEVKEIIQYDFKRNINPRGHTLLLQATFNRNACDKKAKIHTWLAQGGQIVSFGAPVFEFKHGDFDSLVESFQKAMNQSMPDLLKKLYASGYAHYGCC